MNQPGENTAWSLVHESADCLILKHANAQHVQPDDWAARLTDAINATHGVKLVGPKRLDAKGNIFSMGEFVIHPKGFHHLGLVRSEAAPALPGSCYRFATEVDAIAAGLIAVDRQAFETVDGWQCLQGQLGGITLAIELRRLGGRCLCVPAVVVADETTPSPTDDESQAFAQRFGFDWRAADLDRVGEHPKNAAMLWQSRFQSRAMPFEKYEQRPAVHWTNYAKVEVFRKRADHLLGLVMQLCPQGRVLDLGCGDGLYASLLARQGLDVVGIDPEKSALTQAQQMCEQTAPTGPHPTFLQGHAGALPTEENSFDLVMMFDVIEHLPNPAGDLRKLAKALKNKGKLLITTPRWQYEQWSDPVYHVCEYTELELTNQVQACTGLTRTINGQISGIYRDLVMVFEAQ